MAEFLSIADARNYPVAGKVVDLIDQTRNLSESDTVTTPDSLTDVPVGSIAYVYAMGEYRRGVVTGHGRTKVRVTFTTRGSIEEAQRANFGRAFVRIQTKASDLEWVRY
jgi:hypothetical protein